MYSRVYVEITNICNMHCSFCHGHSRSPRQMTEAEYAHVLEQLAGKTLYIYHHLMGEPLVHPLLPRFIQMAAGAGFHPMITTNGTLLDSRGEELLGKGLYKVNISLHSFEGEQQEAHLRYIDKIADFAAKAAEDGTIVSLRLWNNGFDEGKNDVALARLKEKLPGPWAENSRGVRIREKLADPAAQQLGGIHAALPFKGVVDIENDSVLHAAGLVCHDPAYAVGDGQVVIQVEDL
jgi:organic radical activating enzyme